MLRKRCLCHQYQGSSMRNHSPNLFLTRMQFYENCTVGKLTEAQGHLISMTLEPRWRDLAAGQRWVRGKTCIAAGDYPLFYGYDDHLKYQCWRLGKSGVSFKARICFFAKGGSVPIHTRGDILLGYFHHEGDSNDDFNGILYHPAEAFSHLYDYYTALRANHNDLVLRIEPLSTKPSIGPTIESPIVKPDQMILEDYILQTL